MSQDLVVIPLGIFGVCFLAIQLSRKKIDAWQGALSILVIALAAAGSSYALPALYMVMVRVFAGCLLLFLILKEPRQKELGTASRWLFGSLWACLGVGFASVVWSHKVSETLGHALMLALLVLILQEGSRRRWVSPEAIISDLKVFYWVAFPLLGSGVLLYALAVDSAVGHQGRLTGVFTNANMLGYLSIVFAVAGVALWVETRRILYLLTAFILVATGILSESRTALIALTVGLVWIFAGLTVVRKLYVVWAILLLFALWYSFVLLGVFSPLELDAGVLGRFLEDDRDDSLSGRSAIWAFAVGTAIQTRIGVGFGAAPDYLVEVGSSSLVLDTGSAHSSVIQWFLETGLVGAAPMFALLTVCFVIIFRTALASKSFARPLSGVAVAALVTQVTESMIFGTGQIYPWIFWMTVAWLGVLSGQLRTRGENYVQRLQKDSRFGNRVS